MRDIRPAVVNIVNPGFQSDRAMGENCLIRHHLIIAGTGRAGTSLLVKILNACGLETELNRGNGYFWDDRANAGIETLPLAGQEHPYVIKSPWTYQFLDELLSRKDVRIDGLIVPVRDLREAAASRIVIELQNMHRSAPEFDELLAGWPRLGTNARWGHIFFRAGRPSTNFGAEPAFVARKGPRT
jgi:hypothetical protein